MSVPFAQHISSDHRLFLSRRHELSDDHFQRVSVSSLVIAKDAQAFIKSKSGAGDPRIHVWSWQARKNLVQLDEFA